MVFYNGLAEQPDRRELKLSDAYEVAEAEVCLELKVLMLNINLGHNEGLMQNCKTLQDYMRYVEKVRMYTKKMGLEEAVEKAIKECIKDNILAEFLRNHRAEAKNVSIFEYDEELHMKQGREEGREEGRQESIKLMSCIVKGMQADAQVTNEELAERCQISIEEVKKIRESFGM